MKHGEVALDADNQQAPPRKQVVNKKQGTGIIFGSKFVYQVSNGRGLSQEDHAKICSDEPKNRGVVTVLSCGFLKTVINTKTFAVKPTGHMIQLTAMLNIVASCICSVG